MSCYLCGLEVFVWKVKYVEGTFRSQVAKGMGCARDQDSLSSKFFLFALYIDTGAGPCKHFSFSTILFFLNIWHLGQGECYAVAKEGAPLPGDVVFLHLLWGCRQYVRWSVVSTQDFYHPRNIVPRPLVSVSSNCLAAPGDHLWIAPSVTFWCQWLARSFCAATASPIGPKPQPWWWWWEPPPSS